MSKYIQLHVLTSYPASNLNRDDLGRPKTVIMGNTERLRISSQSLKRAWRVSDVFQQALGESIGTRTKELGTYVSNALTQGVTLAEAMQGVQNGSLNTLKDKAAETIASAIANVFGKQKSDSLEIEQLAHLTPAELDGVSKLVEACRESGKAPADEGLALLRADNMAADVALFGRMLAASKANNVDASAQVAHAMTVHKATVDEDFFTAVDDLNRDDSGAGHMGVAEFGAGLFYLYICIDKELLVENLGGDKALANKALAGLAKAVCTVSPTGKQNSFASRAWASYCLAEKTDMQPRTLATAFLDGINGEGDLLASAVKALEDQREKFAAVYGADDASETFNAHTGQGTLDAVCRFIAE